jgi:putative spermidine/putrescine transport system permease protein
LDAGLSAIDVKTLSEAARSLGASWFMVFRAIVVPNMGTAVMSAAFLGVALVLGEFTVANLLSRTNLQVAIYQLGRSDASMSIAVALCSLIFAFGILFVMSFVGNRRRRPADARPSRES